MDIELLHKAIAAVAPIRGVAVGDEANKATWIVDFMPTATSAEMAAAQSVITNYVDNYSTRIRREALRRIYVAIPADLLVFLIGFHLANILTAGDKAALGDLANWIKAMQTAAAGLISTNSAAYEQDGSWPAVPASVTALVLKYTV